MTCRGGELSGPDVDELISNTVVCQNIKENWETYTYWADRAQEFGVDNQGESISAADVISFIERAILATAHKTDLGETVRKSELDRDRVVYLVARTCYLSSKSCSVTVRTLLSDCQGSVE